MGWNGLFGMGTGLEMDVEIDGEMGGLSIFCYVGATCCWFVGIVCARVCAYVCVCACVCVCISMACISTSPISREKAASRKDGNFPPSHLDSLVL